MMPMTVVPSPEVRQLAKAMLYTASHSSCADAVLEHLDDLAPSQYAALITVLLGAARGVGRPMKPMRYTSRERVEAHRLYAQGSKEQWVREAETEYQRDHRRRARLRKATQERKVPADQLALVGEHP